MSEKYSIGLDFGTLSARAVLAEVKTGRVAARSAKAYEHGVMEKALPDGTPLPPAGGWALASPADYLDALCSVVPALLKESGVNPADIAGIGLDVTASTFLPVDEDGVPLCMAPEFASRPHAWMKLWKHHGAQEQAERMTALARERKEDFLRWYGGQINAEWMFPKLAQIAEEDPELYDRTACFMEAGDWLVEQMTGEHTRSACIAGYKLQRISPGGYPSPEYLQAVSPKLRHAAEEKLGGRLVSCGRAAGYLKADAAARLGLLPGTPVSAAAIDAHIAVLGAGICRPGELLMVLGTSSVALLCSGEAVPVPGICGAVKDGILPGTYGYEAGQSSVGDLFDWFVKNGVPEAYAAAAREKGTDLHGLLTEQAERLRPGENGLVALDWWNGNRSCLADTRLKGMIVGLTLATRPEHIYRALIESTAYGMRAILENFEAAGVPVNRVCAAGGIAKKNRLMMQIYADVLDRELFIAAADNASALGSAVLGAVAGGVYPTVMEAAAAMGRVEEPSYKPVPEAVDVYRRLYGEYMTLHDYFGRGGNDVMKRISS